MKEVKVTIDRESVLAGVQMITANAAAQRGDALHVATDDNGELLEGFYDEVLRELIALLSKYAKEGDGLVFSLPDNWDAELTPTLSKGVNDAVLFGVLAKWYSLAGESIYGSMFEGSIEEIVEVLNKRVKPVRNGR